MVPTTGTDIVFSDIIFLQITKNPIHHLTDRWGLSFNWVTVTAC
jgi:hypothetical protein